MGTFYNSRALEWFEVGRTELMRNTMGMTYAALEERGVLLPLVEAHLEFQGRARYDDLLNINSEVAISGRARLRFQVKVAQSATSKPVVQGYTVHTFMDSAGRVMRPPEWFRQMIEDAAARQAAT